MSITVVPPDAALASRHAARRDLVGAFHDAGMWLEAHPGAVPPESPVINIRVHGIDRAGKVARLRVIAASWDVPVVTLPDGTLIAERVFGPLTFEAHVPPDDMARRIVARLDAAKELAA